MLDCGRTGIPAGVLPAIAPGSRPGLTERLAGAPDDESRTKQKLNIFTVTRFINASINAFHLSRNHGLWCGRAQEL